jgi:hypothetical protein
MRTPPIVLGLVAAAALAGCGGGSSTSPATVTVADTTAAVSGTPLDQVKAVGDRYEHAFATGDVKAICALFAETVRNRVEAATGKPCPAAMAGAHAGGIKLTLSHFTVDGDRATARDAQGRLVVFVRGADGRWYVGEDGQST